MKTYFTIRKQVEFLMVTSVCQKTHMSSKDLGLVEASDELVTILLKAHSEATL